jgi:class 3 adenylate cyclase
LFDRFEVRAHRSAQMVDNARVDPSIHYATSSDGVHIAWSAFGSGVPVVWGSTPLGAGIAEQWRIPELRDIFERIAAQSMLVVFDPRGFGLSDRDARDFSMGAMVRDLEAVVEAAALGPFVLQAFSYLSVPSVVFAAEHPERVRALLLLNGVLRGADMSGHWRRMVTLAEDDWDFAKSLLARANEGSYASTLTLAQTEELITSTVSQDAFLAFCGAMAEWDASEVASRVAAPALVVDYGPQVRQTTTEGVRRLAMALPGGAFATVEGGSQGDDRIDRVWEVSVEFLRAVLVRGDRRQAGRSRARPSSAGMAVILFTDIVDSTGLTERLGDEAFRATSREVAHGIRSAIRDSGGTPVDGTVLGDGVLGVFPTAGHAITAAMACVRAAAMADSQLHIGLHAGDVIHEANNVYGGAVNIASRICALCEPGDILVSATVRDLARTSAGVTFEERGEHTLKGISDPIHLYAACPQAPHLDPTPEPRTLPSTDGA